MRQFLLATVLLFQIIPGGPFGGSNVPGPSEMVIYKTTVVLTAGDLAALSGGTVQVLPAASNLTYIPVMARWVKDAGTAWTLNAVARIAVYWDTGAGTKAITNEAAGFFDQAGVQNDYSFPGNTGTGAALVGMANADTLMVGKKMVISREGGTDMSGGTGNCTLTLWYRIVPAS